MRKIIGSVLSDLKKNKFFTVMTMVEILVLILVAGSLMMTFNIDGVRKKTYKKEHADAVVVEYKKVFDEMLDDVDDYATSIDRSYYSENNLPLSTVAVNLNLIKYFDIPYSGEWFSGTINTEYKEALVSRRYKAIYKKNEIYTVKDGTGASKTIKIIGYLGKDDLAIHVTINQYSSFFSPKDMMICDNITKEEVLGKGMWGTVIITEQHDVDYFSKNPNCQKVQTIETAYENYKIDVFPITYLITVISGVLFAIIIVSVLCNSIFRAEIGIRRNIVKHLSGASPIVVASAEVIKTSVIVLIPFLLDIIIAAIMIASAEGQQSFPLMTWRGFWLSSFMVFIVYILSVGAGALRVLTAKPLKELKK